MHFYLMLEKLLERGFVFYYIIIKPQKIDERYKFDLHELDGIMDGAWHAREKESRGETHSRLRF